MKIGDVNQRMLKVIYRVLDQICGENDDVDNYELRAWRKGRKQAVSMIRAALHEEAALMLREIEQIEQARTENQEERPKAVYIMSIHIRRVK